LRLTRQPKQTIGESERTAERLVPRSSPVNPDRKRERTMTALITISIAAVLTQAPAAAPQAPATQPQTGLKVDSADALQLQVMLDRAGFSPGTIDGRMGSNTRKALELFNKSGIPQPPSMPPTTTYRISA